MIKNPVAALCRAISEETPPPRRHWISAAARRRTRRARAIMLFAFNEITNRCLQHLLAAVRSRETATRPILLTLELLTRLPASLLREMIRLSRRFALRYPPREHPPTAERSRGEKCRKWEERGVESSDRIASLLWFLLDCATRGEFPLQPFHPLRRTLRRSSEKWHSSIESFTVTNSWYVSAVSSFTNCKKLDE